jgi:hypothetical protein
MKFFIHYFAIRATGYTPVLIRGIILLNRTTVNQPCIFLYVCLIASHFQGHAKLRLQ